MKNVTAVILGGGAGKRLDPLTRMRAKPAVPLGGKYRLVDVPVACLTGYCPTKDKRPPECLGDIAKKHVLVARGNVLAYLQAKDMTGPLHVELPGQILTSDVGK
jgi:hypothetical protein